MTWTSRLSWTWLLVFVGAAIFAVTPSMELARTLEFGRDGFGRPLIPLVLFAARGSLFFALWTVVGTVVTSILIASAIALLPPRLRELSERALDFFMAFPSLLLALAGQAIFGTGTTTLALSLAIGLLPGTVRFLVVRAREVLAEEYLQAAVALGAGHLQILSRHLLPALLDHLRLKLPILFSQAIAMEATLSFLGVGISVGTVTWGSLLAQAKDYLIEAPHISWMVGGPLVITLLALLSVEESLSRRARSR